MAGAVLSTPRVSQVGRLPGVGASGKRHLRHGPLPGTTFMDMPVVPMTPP